MDWPGLRFNRVASVASLRSGLKSIFIVADPWAAIASRSEAESA